MDVPPLKDAFALDDLKALDVIITCQGGDYTKKVYGDLRSGGWQGYWIDAASTLRMEDEATIIPRPGEPQGHRCAAGERCQNLRGWQLHR
ncbi:hypothetical protein HAALTHF_34390n [Vreelandella aquamarina]|nr:hypothetical protein HAALTHF_34390n [Halomonas axialensis]